MRVIPQLFFSETKRSAPIFTPFGCEDSRATIVHRLPTQT
jgi:hypothetical protein